MNKDTPFYIPDEDEPSVFSSAVRADNDYPGSGGFNHHLWGWPNWRREKRWKRHFEHWRAKNPDANPLHCPPSFGSDTTSSEGLKLIVRLRSEIQDPDYPVFDPAPTMFIGDTRQISLRWVLQTAKTTGISPDEAVLIAEKERDLGGLTLHDQDQWQSYWWKKIMELPGLTYPIWRYQDGRHYVAVPYLLLPGPASETIVIYRVHEKNPNITYKLVTIRQRGGEVVGEFTGYEGFDREQLDTLLNTFWAGF
jgi:hypothetical protein